MGNSSRDYMRDIFIYMETKDTNKNQKETNKKTKKKQKRNKQTSIKDKKVCKLDETNIDDLT